jgi:heat shock protein HslJ
MRIPAPVLFGLALPLTAAWLDQPLANWNRVGSGVPRAASMEPVTDKRCLEQIRQPLSAMDKAVVKAGWKLYGPVQSYGTAAVFLAMSGADGMCRPMGYQAFVYVGARYAGTLAPAPMNSRVDASLSGFRLVSATSIGAEFSRYVDSDALCCPSRTSTVNYQITGGVVVAAKVTGGSLPLSGRQWILREIGGQKLNAAKPFVEFNEQERRVSGDSGCNRFSGAVEVTGAALTFSRFISTRRACLDQDGNRLESDFLAQLEKSTRFEIQETTLRLFSGDRAVLVFRSER